MAGRHHLRLILVVANLGLLVAPHWAVAQEATKTEKGRNRTITRPAPKPTHRATGKVRPTSEAPTSSPTRPADDDDAGQKVGSAVARGCCAALIGAAVSSANDPEPRGGRGVAGSEVSDDQYDVAADPPERTSNAARGPFDASAMRDGLKKAQTEIRKRCDAPERDEVHVLVTVGPLGRVTSVDFEPPFADSVYAECAENQIREIRVEPFDGEPTTVEKKLRLRASSASEPPPDAPESSVPAGDGGTGAN